MPVSVFEVTMATPDEVCVEVRDAPITHGQIFSNSGVSIAETSPQAFPIVGVSQSPIDGSIRITSSGNPFAAFYWEIDSDNAGIVGIAGVQGIPGINGSWDSLKISNNVIDLMATVYTPGWVPGTGKVWDYFNWTTYAPAGRRGWLAGANQDFFRSCDLEPSAFLNRAAANVPANWAAFGGRTVTAVYMKSKNYDRGYADLPTLGQFSLTSSLKHFIHLKLSGPLPQGGPYTIANASAGISTSFTFNDRTTRAIAIHVSGVGHRPSDASKLGYLSLWRPGAPNEGAVDFTALGLTQFEIIDSTNTTVAGPLPIALRIGATEAEERIGLDVDNILAGYPDTYGMVAYNSTDPTKNFIISAVTSAAQAEFTTSTNHGFTVGTRLRLIDMGGDGIGLPALTHLTIKVATVSAPNKFTGFQFGDTGLWDKPIRTDDQPLYSTWTAVGRTGKVCRLYQSNRAGTNVYGMDYSGFTPGTAGNYRLRIIGLGVSDPIPFNNTAWRAVVQAMAKGEYHHRWGIDLDGRFGTTRPKNYVDGVTKGGNQGKIYQSKVPYPFGWGAPLFSIGPSLADGTCARPEWFFPTGTPGQFYQSGYGLGGGSWADAGDWCTRPASTAGACYAFCELTLLRPIKSAATALNIPKSAALFPTVPEYVGTDDMPDMVHQAIFGMECFRRMQHGVGSFLPEGSVPGGLMMDTSTGTTSTPSHLTPSVNYANAPDQMTNFYYAFAAAKIAQLCYAYNHPAAGDMWKNSAIKAWDWAELIFSSVTERENYYNGLLGIEAKAANANYVAGNQPAWSHDTYITNRETLNNDVNSGPARCCAASTLFRLTGAANYKTAVETGLGYINNNPNLINFDPYAGKSHAAWEYAQTPGVNAQARTNIRSTFSGGVVRIEAGLEHFSGPNKAPCRSLMVTDGSLFNLGGQGFDLGGASWSLIVTHIINGDARSLKTIQDGMAFIYGANMLSMSSVAQVGNRWPGTIFNADQLFSGVECAVGIGCYFYSFLGQWSFAFGTWSSASNGGCIESPDPKYTVDHIFEREVIPGRYATPIFEGIWESHFSLNLMERSIQQDVFPLQNVAFYLDAWDEVVGITSTTALVSSENPTFVGSSITFTATVTGSGATPTGAVTFRDGGSSIGSGNLNAGGVATFATSALSAGIHSITAVYGGDATYAGSSSPPVAEDVRAIISAAYKVSPPVFGVH